MEDTRKISYRRLTKRDEELELLCRRNGRSLTIYSNGDYETADLYDGCDRQRFKTYEECLEWENGYILPWDNSNQGMVL